MSSIMRILIFLLLTTLITGCSLFNRPTFFQNRNKEYLAARTVPPLQIPPGISPGAFQSYYPVPYRDYPEEAKDASVIPPGLYG